MRIILLGAPGAGKGTQAETLSRTLDVPIISTGNILRKAMREGTELGIKAKEYVEAGKLVPDDIIIGVMADSIAGPDCANGYILDGVPRTIPQAEALEKAGVVIDAALSIDISDNRIIERMSGRRFCTSCSVSYHIKHNPPKIADTCDVCGETLVIRHDDAPETVKARLETYHDETEPLLEFYSKRGLLRTVESQEEVEDTTALVLKALGINA